MLLYLFRRRTYQCTNEILFLTLPISFDRSLADMEDMYHSWKADPESVHVSWRSVFARMDAGALPGQSFVPPPSLNAGQSLQASAVPAGGVSLVEAIERARGRFDGQTRLPCCRV